MEQKITGFHKDADDHWVADLECGHAQHVRHDPPWMERKWVTTEDGRASRLGSALNCVRCDEMGEKIAQAVIADCRKVLGEAYESAGISGLCDEGRFEVALGALDALDTKTIIVKALKLS